MDHHVNVMANSPLPVRPCGEHAAERIRQRVGHAATVVMIAEVDRVEQVEYLGDEIDPGVDDLIRALAMATSTSKCDRPRRWPRRLHRL